MYKVYLDDEILQDSSTFLIDPKLDLAQNSAGSFSFGMYPEHPLYDSITPTSVIKVVQLLDDGSERWIWSGRLKEPAEEFDLYRSFEAEGVLAYLADSIQRPAEYHDISVIDFLSTILEIHNSQVDDFKKIKLGVVTVTDPNDSLYRYTNYEDTLSVIKDKLVDRLGGILRMRQEPDGLYLDYLADYPRQSTQRIEFGENLMDLLQQSSYADAATLLIPLGARLEDEEKSPNWPEALEQRVTIAGVNNGKDYLIDNEAALEKGKVVKVATWDDVHVPSILKAKAQEFLNTVKYESRTITAKAIDLSTTGFDVGDFRWLDRIRIVSEPHNIDLVFPLTSMTIYLLHPESNVYTLGSETKSYTSSQSQSQVTVKETLALLPARISAERDKAIQHADQILQQWASLGYAVHTENESYYMDAPKKEDAQYVLRINAGGIGFSKTGFDGPYTSAWTIDGSFNADFITAGTIAAERIDIRFKEDLLNTADEMTDEKLLDYYKTTEFSVAPGQIKSEIDAVKEYADNYTYSRNVIDQKLNDQENSIALKVSSGVQQIMGTRKLFTCLSSTLSAPAKSEFTEGAKEPSEYAPYMWGFERIKTGETTYSDDAIRLMSVYGKKGDDGVSITGMVREYAVSTSSTVAPSEGWETSIPTYSDGSEKKYLWERETVTKSDGSQMTTTPKINSFWGQLEDKWAQIRLDTDNIALEVADKVGSSEISSLFEQSADLIRLKASKITWTSENSSMTEDGILTCTDANLAGDLNMKKKIGTWNFSAHIGEVTTILKDNEITRGGFEVFVNNPGRDMSSSIVISPAPNRYTTTIVGADTSIISATNHLVIEAISLSNDNYLDTYAYIDMKYDEISLGGRDTNSSRFTTCLSTFVGSDGSAGGSLSGRWYLPQRFFNGGNCITDTTTQAPNLWLGSSNTYMSRSSSSSRRYKYDITNVDDDLDPRALYSLPVRSFTYNAGYLSSGDQNDGKRMIGFIAEEVAEVYPKAAQYNEDGTVEMWNSLIMIPAMLYLIQSQNERLKKLEGDNS